MKTTEFTKKLKEENILFEKKGKTIVITKNQGDVYLRSLTSLPENTKFENQGGVYLRSLTSLPENTKFENQGGVYLESLTSLPENTKFENQGYVNLESLTSFDETEAGEENRSLYVVNSDKYGLRLSLGCFTGTEEECIKAIQDKYGDKGKDYIEKVKNAFKKGKKRHN